MRLLVCLLFLCASAAAATVVPKQIVADVAPYVDAGSANADAANIDWLGNDPRQDAVTLAWASLELATALKSAGIPARVYAPGHANAKLPTIQLSILPAAALGDQGFRISTSTAGILVEGRTRIGVLYGAYRVLDRLGFRWYSPTDKVVPANLAATVIDWPAWSEDPAVRWRGFWIPLDGVSTPVGESYAIWMARNRLNLTGTLPLAIRAKLGQTAWNGGHRLLQEELSAAGVFAAHPEWFALVDGQRRSISATTGTFYNPSFVNPDLANWFADRMIARLSGGDLADVDMLAIWPSDGKIRGWDESPEARAYGNNTDTLLLFYARVADDLAQAVADGRLNRPVTISGITYNDTWELPTRLDILPVLGSLDYVHVYYDPERSFGGALTDDLSLRDSDRIHVQRLADWKALGGLRFGITEYFNNSNYGGVPIIEHRSLLQDFGLQMGGGGSLFAYMHPLATKPGPRKLTNWLVANLAWRGVATGPDEYEGWIADYFAQRYPHAATEMRAIYDLMDTAASNGREVFLRVSLRHLLFIQQRSTPVWTVLQVSDLANRYLNGGHQVIPAPGAKATTDTVSADFVGVFQSLALLAQAKQRIDALATDGENSAEKARRIEDRLWAYGAWQRYELLRVATLYYREINLLVASTTTQAHHDRIVSLNSLLGASVIMKDTVTPLVVQSENLYPPEWLVFP